MLETDSKLVGPYPTRREVNVELAALAMLGVLAIKRVFDHADADVAVEDTSVEIALGDEALPTGAIAIGYIADITEDWSDGGAGVFAADLGDGDNYFTPTQLNLDGGVALAQEVYLLPAGGLVPKLTITGDVNLDTLTTGTMTLWLLYIVPVVTTVEAPTAE